MNPVTTSIEIAMSAKKIVMTVEITLHFKVIKRDRPLHGETSAKLCLNAYP